MNWKRWLSTSEQKTKESQPIRTNNKKTRSFIEKEKKKKSIQYLVGQKEPVADMSLRSRGRRKGIMVIPVEVRFLGSLRFFHFCFLINGCDRDWDSNNDTISELMVIEDSLACNRVKEILSESGGLNWPSSRQRSLLERGVKGFLRRRRRRGWERNQGK